MVAAEPVLRAIGDAIGSEIVFPGNHDAPGPRPGPSLRAQLASQWRYRRSASAGSSVGVAGAGAVRVSYPGVWLGDRIWATHGHYLDHHLIPDSAFGLPRGRLATARARSAPIGVRAGRLRSRHGAEPLRRPLTAAPDGRSLIRSASRAAARAASC